MYYQAFGVAEGGPALVLGNIVIARSGEEVELVDGQWQCGECGRIHESGCRACSCLTGEPCDCARGRDHRMGRADPPR